MSASLLLRLAAAPGRPLAPRACRSRAGLRRQLIRGVSPEALLSSVLAADGPRGLKPFTEWLMRLADRRALVLEVHAGAALLASAPVVDDLPRLLEGVGPDRPVVLSRFAYCRRSHDRLVLQSPASSSTIRLHDPRACALLAELVVPTPPGAFGTSSPSISAESARAFLDLLWGTRMLQQAGRAGATDEETQPALRDWEFHDLLFHARSRAGRHDNWYGARPRRTRAARPAREVPVAPAGVRLFRPSLAAVARRDRAFTAVLERRRSERRHGATPITLRQLGEFLYRAAGARTRRLPSGRTSASRPYPAAGGAHELFVYLAVRRSAGLAPGLYRYDAPSHTLHPVSKMTRLVRTLLQSAAHTAHAGPPQILVVMAARFADLTSRYGSVAYALILKDVGVLMQTMALVAEAMGLAGCPLGGGNADLFARAAGTDYYAETSVGEFMIGRRRAP